jgi:hypothetical protein
MGALTHQPHGRNPSLNKNAHPNDNDDSITPMHSHGSDDDGHHIEFPQFQVRIL